MFKTQNEPTESTALYCPNSGKRIAPSEASGRPDATPVAVAVFDDGTSVPILTSSILGREPELTSHPEHYQRLRIADTSQQISRTHLMFYVDEWKIAAVDLGSTNGTMVQDESGCWDKLVPGLRCWISNGQKLKLGTREVTVHHTTR